MSTAALVRRDLRRLTALVPTKQLALISGEALRYAPEGHNVNSSGWNPEDPPGGTRRTAGRRSSTLEGSHEKGLMEFGPAQAGRIRCRGVPGRTHGYSGRIPPGFAGAWSFAVSRDFPELRDEPGLGVESSHFRSPAAY